MPAKLTSDNGPSTSKVHQFLHGSSLLGSTLEQVMKQRKDSLFARQQQRRADMIQKKRFGNQKPAEEETKEDMSIGQFSDDET